MAGGYSGTEGGAFDLGFFSEIKEVAMAKGLRSSP